MTHDVTRHTIDNGVCTKNKSTSLDIRIFRSRQIYCMIARVLSSTARLQQALLVYSVVLDSVCTAWAFVHKHQPTGVRIETEITFDILGAASIHGPSL